MCDMEATDEKPYNSFKTECHVVLEPCNRTCCDEKPKNYRRNSQRARNNRLKKKCVVHAKSYLCRGELNYVSAYHGYLYH